MIKWNIVFILRSVLLGSPIFKNFSKSKTIQNLTDFHIRKQNTFEICPDLFLVSEKEKQREKLRMKTGRSKRCLDCKKHRCVIDSCHCDCHKDFSGRIVPRVSRQMPTKKETRTKN